MGVSGAAVLPRMVRARLPQANRMCHPHRSRLETTITIDMTALRRARTHMGRAAGAMAAGRGARSEVHDDWWAALSGVDTPDANMALVHGGGALALDAALDVLAVHAPGGATLALAGEARALGDGVAGRWEEVGSMPLLRVDLGGVQRCRDERVRAAVPGDAPRIAALVSAANGVTTETATALLGFLATGSPTVRAWLLADEPQGEPLATVVTARERDIVSVWSMSTAPPVARRGYGRALLATVLDWAIRDGATVGLLGSTAAGRPFYDAAGWQWVEDWRLYASAASAQFSA
jgi:GNAT superfamily N-acetyltransferase